MEYLGMWWVWLIVGLLCFVPYAIIRWRQRHQKNFVIITLGIIGLTTLLCNICGILSFFISLISFLFERHHH